MKLSHNKNGFVDYSYQGKVSGDNLYLCMQPPPPLSRWVQCFWQLNVPQGRYAYRSVPDNNVDCIFALNHTEESFFVAPFHSPAIFEMDGPVSYFGIRFRVLAQQWLTTLPIGEWGDLELAEIFNTLLIDELYENINSRESFHTRCNMVGQVLLANLSYRGIDRRFTNFVQYAHQYPSSKVDLSDKQCAEFGLSSRHLRRLCQLYLSLSPRNFNRVLRFQKTLHLMNTSNSPLVWADYYYDQSHFNREFKNLSGLTPGEFSNLSVLYNPSDNSE